MKSLYVFLAMLAFLAGTTCLRAEDWKTTDGKIYQDVKVVHTDADSVTILHHEGGGRVPLAKLPPELQKRFNYNPAAAKVAVEARAKADAENRHRLQVEMNATAQKNAVQDVPVAATAPDVEATPGSEVPTGVVAVLGGSGDYSIDAVVKSAASLGPDPNDSTHHTIGELADSAQSMRHSLSDPNYSTTSHIVYVIRQQGLGPDKSDPKHHTISEIAGH